MAWRAFVERTQYEDGQPAHLLECGHLKAPHESRHRVPYARQWCNQCAGPFPKVEQVWISRVAAQTALEVLEQLPQDAKLEAAVAGLRSALRRKEPTT